MSEPIPEAIPTSADSRSRRPIKRLRGANTAIAAQANEVENLMWDPSVPVEIPPLSSDTKPALTPPPEIVANVQGSSAGAGSGEFHVYKASRRREYERLRAMDEEAKEEEETDKWRQEQEERRRKDEERTAKNREKRSKRRGKKGQITRDATSEPEESSGSGTAAVQRNGSVRKLLQIPKKINGGSDESREAETAPAAVAEPSITIHDDD